MMEQRSQQVPPVGHRGNALDVYAPDGSEIRLLADARQQATRASLVEVSLAPGGVSRPVWHRTVEEIWYVLQGTGRVWRCPEGMAADSVAPVDVGPGDALAIPAGWKFQFSAGEDETLRFLCYTSPPWPGEDEAQPADAGGLGEPTV